MTAVANLSTEPVGLPDNGDAERWPAELELLLGEDARGLLDAVVHASGGRLRSWSPRQVNHQPGRSTVVQYRADVERTDGTTATETVVAATGDRIPSGAAVLDDGTTRVGVWAWPFDPSLPGLQQALDPVYAATLLDELGIGTGAVALRVRAYRPGRRAVIEASGSRGRLFLKVVRPAVVESLHATHRQLAASLPVPDSLGWTDRGVLVLPGLPGRTLREVLRSSDEAPPPPQAIGALLDRLPSGLAARSVRRSLLDAADHHAGVIASALPSRRGQVDDLLGELHARDVADHPLVAVHGDLYEAQLLARNGRLTGLLDIDTAAAGHRVEDMANFCAHLSVLARATDRPKAVKRYGSALLAHAEQRFDRADLRVRIAAAVVGLATGPFRVLERNWPHATDRRLELAQEWIDGI
jgi:aminoglycoside phosphotransferase